jgi:hypothetical protein
MNGTADDDAHLPALAMTGTERKPLPPHDRLESTIATIVADTSLHARWLNTFSFLEYVGFRKIVKSQQAETLTGTVLNHAIEEGRHALGLRKIAVKLGGASFDSYAPETLLCGEEAEAYFQDLDAACDAAFADRPEAERTRLAYATVTALVERRALDVYGVYSRALGGSEIARKLEGLLAEEVKHLGEVQSWLAEAGAQSVIDAAGLSAREAELYERFLDALEREFAAETLRAATA